jgi:hypothetical protein
VDHCELEVGGEVLGPRLVYAANAEFWAMHGMETNGWMATVQYRDQILARNKTMPPGSGGTVRYRFRVSEDLDPTGIRLAIETPELWTASVNGYSVDLSGGERWLDVHTKATDVGNLLVPGQNVIELEGRPFDVRREIDAIYLLGDFSCTEEDPGFGFASPQPLNLGPWRQQGHPFYDREVAYDFRLPESGVRGILSLDEEAWHGSFLLVEQYGEVVARLWEPPYEVPVEGSSGGRITLRIVGLPKNLLGPWHDPKRQRGRAWIPMWYGPDVPTSPQPGERYDLIDPRQPGRREHTGLGHHGSRPLTLRRMASTTYTPMSWLTRQRSWPPSRATRGSGAAGLRIRGGRAVSRPRTSRRAATSWRATLPSTRAAM